MEIGCMQSHKSSDAQHTKKIQPYEKKDVTSV